MEGCVNCARGHRFVWLPTVNCQPSTGIKRFHAENTEIKIVAPAQVGAHLKLEVSDKNSTWSTG